MMHGENLKLQSEMLLDTAGTYQIHYRSSSNLHKQYCCYR